MSWINFLGMSQRLPPGGSKRQPELRTYIEENCEPLERMSGFKTHFYSLAMWLSLRHINTELAFNSIKMGAMICSCFSQVWVSNERMNINDMLCKLLLRTCLDPWVREHAAFKPINEPLSFPVQGTCPSICGEKQRRRKHTPTQLLVQLN